MKLYVRELGTDHLLELANSSVENRFAVLALSQVEFRSAIRRRERGADISPKVAGLILDRFQQHMETRFLRQVLSDEVLDGASEMVDRYALRAYDAIQLAGCLALKITVGVELPTFVCSDRHLLEAARSEQLSTLDPGVPN